MIQKYFTSQIAKKAAISVGAIPKWRRRKNA